MISQDFALTVLMWKQKEHSLHHGRGDEAAVLDGGERGREVSRVRGLHHLFVPVHHVQVAVELFPNFLGQLYKNTKALTARWVIERKNNEPFLHLAKGIFAANMWISVVSWQLHIPSPSLKMDVHIQFLIIGSNFQLAE